MITSDRVKELASFYNIDSFTIIREYLQLLFLNYLYRIRKANKIYFKGGTAIHLLFGSFRFSEDLDFSCAYDGKEIKEMISHVEIELGKELTGVRILFLYQGKQGIRFRLKYSSTIYTYPFVIRIDFTKEKRLAKPITSPLATRFPLIVFPLVSHLSAEEILAEKIRALFIRGKPRDLFDLWFLLTKKVRIDLKLVNKKLAMYKDRRFTMENLKEKIAQYDEKTLKTDLNHFLPIQYREFHKDLKKVTLALLKH